MNETPTYQHHCGTCQIRVYMQRHHGVWLNTKNCPYTCDYKDEMREFIRKSKEVCRNCRMWVRAHEMSGICTLYGDVMKEYGACDEWEERKGEDDGTD